MDIMFSRPTHVTVWRQLRGKPIITDDVRSSPGSIIDDVKKKDVVEDVPSGNGVCLMLGLKWMTRRR